MRVLSALALNSIIMFWAQQNLQSFFTEQFNIILLEVENKYKTPECVLAGLFINWSDVSWGNQGSSHSSE